MGVAELVGLAGSVGLLSGWRIYLCTFATGVAMHYGWIALPQHLHALDVLAHPVVIGISGLGLVAEFFADKVPWLDSLWDTVHTLVRPVGGALLASAILDPQDPTWQVASVLLGGSAALLTHGAKASLRAVANTSPEPFSNIALSLGEDVTAGGLLLLAITHPATAAGIAVLLAGAALAATVLLWRLLRRLAGGPAPGGDARVSLGRGSTGAGPRRRSPRR